MLHMLLLPAKNNQKPTKNQRRNFFTPFNFGPWLVLNPMKTKENQRRIFFTPFNCAVLVGLSVVTLITYSQNELACPRKSKFVVPGEGALLHRMTQG